MGVQTEEGLCFDVGFLGNRGRDIADAVRSTHASASMSSSFRLCLFVCLSLVRVPESRVNRCSVFLGGGEVYSAGRCKGVVCRSLGCLVSGVGSWQPNR